ncbi:MAG: GNAT family N-acetyltransferase [Candidatus Bathyarchaeota archaeon]|nr:GNAT family N-acetyltransferase [Candidatus Bathyarchaeota archaeon]
MVGLEMHGHVALLRSLVVLVNKRGSSLGAALVSHAEQYAAQQRVYTIYLLTTTAAGFFERHGYSHVSRQTAPAAIAGTSQFSGLCPSSSAFMAKSVGS